MTTMPASVDAAASIRALDREFEKNANAGNPQALVEAFYSEDAHLLPPGAPGVSGTDAITQFWSGMMAAGAKDVKLETTDISASGDLAYGVGRYGLTVGEERKEGKYVVVYRRRPDGAYRAVVDMFSPNS